MTDCLANCMADRLANSEMAISPDDDSTAVRLLGGRQDGDQSGRHIAGDLPISQSAIGIQAISNQQSGFRIQESGFRNQDSGISRAEVCFRAGAVSRGDDSIRVPSLRGNFYFFCGVCDDRISRAARIHISGEDRVTSEYPLRNRGEESFLIYERSASSTELTCGSLYW